MTVYLIIESKVKDPKAYRAYRDKVPETVARHGGRYLARGSRIKPLSGGWEPERLILVEFPGERNVSEWLSSPEYRTIAPLREAGADTRAVMIEAGMDGYNDG
jgi:uncharacterized protein (DUF1330 family)